MINVLIHLINEQHNIFHIHNNLFYFIIFKVKVYLLTKNLKVKLLNRTFRDFYLCFNFKIHKEIMVLNIPHTHNCNLLHNY